MSSDADSSTSALEAALRDLYTDNYCQVITAAFFFYEVVITFDREVASFWTARRTPGASLLYHANKYLSIIAVAMMLATMASFPSDKSCSLFSIATHAIDILQYVPWGVFSALRAWVLSKSKLFGLTVLGLSLAPAGANLVVYGYQLSGEVFDPPFGCIVSNTESAEIDLMFVCLSLNPRIVTAGINIHSFSLVIVARAPLIIADILLIYITWAKLDSRDALRSIRKHKRRSFSDVLFCDGTIYFTVLFITNILHLAFSLTAVANDGQGSYLTAFTSPITAILVSRFLLELQEANQTVIRLDSDDPLHSSRNMSEDTPSFISSLGACINPDLMASRDEDVGSYLAPRSVDGEEENAQGSRATASSSSA